MGEEKRQRHSIWVEERERMRICGVRDVIHFDEESIAMETDCGLLIIKGANLHVGKLNLEEGEVTADGQVDAVTYAEGGAEGKGSIFSRIFR